jgi:hypothetical protein
VSRIGHALRAPAIRATEVAHTPKALALVHVEARAWLYTRTDWTERFADASVTPTIEKKSCAGSAILMGDGLLMAVSVPISAVSAYSAENDREDRRCDRTRAENSEPTFRSTSAGQVKGLEPAGFRRGRPLTRRARREPPAE